MRHGLEAYRRQAVMATVPLSEPVKEAAGDGVEDIAVKRPFEETEEQVRRQK